MGFSQASNIDFAKISTEMQWVSKRWFNGTIQIIDPNLENLVWNEWSNTGSTTETLLWTGKAKITPIASAATESNAGMALMGGRRVRFHVPLDEARIFVRKGLIVRVTDGGQFPDLEDLSFVVSSSIASSYAWLLAIECEADIKSDLD